MMGMKMKRDRIAIEIDKRTPNARSIYERTIVSNGNRTNSKREAHVYRFEYIRMKMRSLRSNEIELFSQFVENAMRG
jgi:hypothetical protein